MEDIQIVLFLILLIIFYIKKYFTKRNNYDIMQIEYVKVAWGGRIRPRPHADGLTGGTPRDAGELDACQTTV